MKQSLKENVKYLSLFFGILVIITFVKNIVFFLKNYIIHFNSIYTALWIGLLIWLFIYFIKKIEGINSLEFIMFSVFVGVFIGLITLVLNMYLGTNNLIEKNYIALYGITEEYVGETEKSIDHLTNVYRINDKRVKTDSNYLENKYGEAFEENFLFWQTAFAYGYEPKGIQDYKGTDSFSKNITLLLTVGPLFLLETFINAILNTWILMIIPVIGIFFKKRIYYEKLKPFRKLFESKVEKSVPNDI